MWDACANCTPSFNVVPYSLWPVATIQNVKEKSRKGALVKSDQNSAACGMHVLTVLQVMMHGLKQ